MNRFDRIYQLHRLLLNARRPLSMAVLEQRMECSRATIKRVIQEMRLYLHAPIEYDREHNGYHYDDSQSAHPYELPGLWFNASELHALLTVQQLLAQVQPGLLEPHLAPLRRRIEAILASESLAPGDIARRIRILRLAARPAGNHFQIVADALMQRRRLWIRYHARARDQISERTVSPQRLVHYRDNWYLDAWCHRRGALRTFSLDRIQDAQTLEQAAREVEDTRLERYLSSSYGIFSGEATSIAVLRFTPAQARWVADERWHPQQQGRFLPDGCYELSIPYSDPRELVMDILKYGPEVEVMSPVSLRQQVAQSLREAATRYE